MIENGKVPEAISAGLNGRDGIPSVEPAPDAVHRPAAMSVFAKRVASVLATRVTLFVMAFATSILLSRLLGPDGKGAYVAVVTLPGMLAAVGLFGLPGAVNYFAGRGASMKSLIRATYASTAVLSVLLVGVVWFSLPVLETSILRAAPDNLVRVLLLAVPLGTLLGQGLSSWTVVTLPFILALAGGILIYVTSNEIIPESHSHGHEGAASTGLIMGFLLTMLIGAVLR